MLLGLIGMGEMGRMYANKLLHSTTIIACDTLTNYHQLVQDYSQHTNVTIVPDGHHVARQADFIIYSVEAEHIDKVVKLYGPSTKVGATVAGQTSVKAPERIAFERYLPPDVHILSIHSLHGPSIPTDNQALILIQHRAPNEKLEMVKELLKDLNSRYVEMSYEEHDIVTANTQAVTHAAFLSMGTAWKSMNSFPWETGRYIGGIEVVKINITLRIYAAQWHVYAGLAILNPVARGMIETYSKSVSELFKLMIEEKFDQFRDRIYKAREFVFGMEGGKGGTTPLLLSDKVLDKFSIGLPPSSSSSSSSSSSDNNDDHHHDDDSGANGPPPNSHLALLAMVDTWHILKINPFNHLALAATPVFRLWIGVAEYLFRDTPRLDRAIQAAVWDKSHRSDDAEFLVASRGWSQCVNFGGFELYRERFEECKKFFAPRFEESRKVGNDMFLFMKEELEAQELANANATTTVGRGNKLGETS